MINGRCKTINLAISCDDRYFKPFCVLITSILLNNKQSYFHFHVIITGIEEQIKEKIKNFVLTNNSKITFYTIDLFQPETLNLPDHPWFTSAIYYRIFFPLIVPANVDTLIYLDTDIVVVNKLDEMLEVPITDVPLAAVVDSNVSIREDLRIFEPGNYFNSGVLLINLNVWNKLQISQKAIDFIKLNPDKIPYGDQCALNAVLVNNWKKIDNKFNVMFQDVPRFVSKSEVVKSITDKVIIHFTTKHKPWTVSCVNPYRFLYSYYFYRCPLLFKASLYSDLNYSFYSLSSYLKLRLIELYYEFPVIKKFWKMIKHKSSRIV
ncbi:glycosyltransferase family 8 protein [Pontibacter sp. KCTC 32443]|uniref:glycosyltransferase family 8 protein n=1 Tax=Pontibacter TaxID=323449 RepID=UPI00164D09D8|nr:MULTISPECIES: glycosyltransferase family 8 protein [Pontibacter]MBC5773496.1 glycosyltransferase family 8 protein [Pontibacter sp. KCTC 32443]